MVQLAQLIPYVQMALILGAVALTAWAFAPWRSSVGRARINIRVALLTGVVVGIAAFVAMGSLLGFGCFDASPDSDCTTAFGLAQAVAGLLAAVTSFIGYAVFARLKGGHSIAGSFVGPVVVVALAIGVGLLFQNVSYAAQREQDAQAAAQVVARSTILHPTIGEIRVTTSAGGTVVETVQLRVTLHVDHEIRLDVGGKSANPRFVFAATGGMTIEGTGGASSGSPLRPAIDTTYDLTFVGGAVAGAPTGQLMASTFVSPSPGTWRLRIEVLDDAGVEYQVETDVVISAAA